MATPTKQKQYNTFEPGAQLKVDHVKRLDDTYTTSPALTFFPKDTNNNTSLDTLKKCKFCRKLFKDAENNDFACRHHAGKYASSQYAFGVKRWTCCKMESENADGCTVTPHGEDEKTSTILSAFSTPVDPSLKKEKKTPERQTSNGNSNNNSNNKSTSTTKYTPYGNGTIAQPSQDTLDFLAQISQLKAASNEPSTAQQKKPKKPKSSKQQIILDEEGNPVTAVELQDSPKITYQDDESDHSSSDKKESKTNTPKLKPGEVVHTVDKSDTLQGISIKYGVPVQDIKKANRLFSNSIFGHKTLVIPRPS